MKNTEAIIKVTVSTSHDFGDKWKYCPKLKGYINVEDVEVLVENEENA